MWSSPATKIAKCYQEAALDVVLGWPGTHLGTRHPPGNPAPTWEPGTTWEPRPRGRRPAGSGRPAVEGGRG